MTEPVAAAVTGELLSAGQPLILPQQPSNPAWPATPTGWSNCCGSG